MRDIREQKVRAALAITLMRTRYAQGLNQEELADKSELSRQYISMVERQERSPNFLTLVKLCHGLGIDLLSFMVELTKEMNNDMGKNQATQE